MIKNIIFDIGGIILDDSLENISKVYGKDMSNVYKKVYTSDFSDCILGKKSMTEYLKQFQNDKDYKYISEILNPRKQEIFNPLIRDNYEYICSLKDRGYHLYILSNLTKETYDYLNSVIDINKYFDGAIFSWEVGLRKQEKDIFKLMINKYNLDLSETIFFYDKERNVNNAISVGINSKIFNTINDVEKELNENI